MKLRLIKTTDKGADYEKHEFLERNSPIGT